MFRHPPKRVRRPGVCSGPKSDSRISCNETGADQNALRGVVPTSRRAEFVCGGPTGIWSSRERQTRCDGLGVCRSLRFRVGHPFRTSITRQPGVYMPRQMLHIPCKNKEDAVAGAPLRSVAITRDNEAPFLKKSGRRSHYRGPEGECRELRTVR